MDPAALMQQQLQKNFPKFGKIRKSCIYQVMGDALYDAGTGAPIENVEAEYPLLAVFDVLSTSLRSNIQVDEDEARARELMAFIFPALDLPVTPKNGDRIIMEDSRKWGVISPVPDPAGAHWELVVRPWT